MKKILFKAENMYKANLHCHTTISDGALTVEEIKEAYKNRDYSIVAFTDHRVLKVHSNLNDDSFLAINALEVDINEKYEEGKAGKSWSNFKTYHLNLYATKTDMTETPPLPTMDYFNLDAINKYIQDRRNEGFLVCYNHPYWSMQDFSDYGGLKGLFAMEIYNHGCEMAGYDGYHPRAYDEMLRVLAQSKDIGRPSLYCVSADDNHNKNSLDSPNSDSFGGFVMINSPKLEYECVMQALKQGDFYSSQGPQIYEIAILRDNKGKDRLNVKCSDAKLIIVYTEGRKRYIKHAEGENLMQEAEFTLTGDKYIRVTVRDRDGKDANSNAFWIDRINEESMVSSEMC